MRIIDTHCHPQFAQFDADRDEVIRRALDSGIGMVCVGTDLETSRQAVQLAERYEGLYASVGLHPNDNLHEPYDQDAFRALAHHPKVVAIGEVGLDYYRTTDEADRLLQKKRFATQLDLAHEMGKPLIIHCRDAHDDMISVLSTHEHTRGVIHSFNGTKDQAAQYIAMGMYIGLNAIITFSQSYDEMVQSIPFDRMLLETDAPYLAPAPHRGGRNESAYVDIVADHIAGLLGDDREELARRTTANAVLLYGMQE